MAFQRHGVQTSMMPPTQSGFQHHNPNKETGPLTQIARDYATGKVTGMADEAIDPAIKSVTKYGKSLFTAPSAATTTAAATTAAAAPASIGTAMPAAITALGPAGAPGMLSAGLGGAAAGTTGALTGAVGGAAAGGAATGGLMAAAAPMLTALGPIGLAIGGGMLASQLLKGGDKSHVQHLNEGNKVQMPLLDGREAVEAERMAELERLRQAWLNRNNPEVITESIPNEMYIPEIPLHFSREQPAPESYNFPTERIDDVRFKGGPPDMIGPLAPNANEDAKTQLELAIKEGEHISEQLRKDKLNDAKIAKIESDSKGKAMNLSGYEKTPVTFTDENGTVHYAHEPYDRRTDELIGRINTILYPPLSEEAISIIPEARPYAQQMPLLDGREAVEAERIAELERLRAEYLAKNNLNKGGKVCSSCGKSNCGCGYNHGGTVGPLGRSQMRTPTAIAHAKAYDYYNKAASARRDPFGMYFGKQMIRSFPGEAPLSMKERIVDPLKAKSPTLFGRINLGK